MPELQRQLAESAEALQDCRRQLAEALEQQTATSDVLRVIAGSPTELQPVLDAVTESAVKLAGARRGHIRQYDGEFLRLVAAYGESPEELAVFQVPVRLSAESRSGRAFLERKPIHDVDAQVERHPMAAQTGARTALAVPLLREATPIGVFTIWRDVVEPFTDRQIELVKTFADQAVVAIENVRLFQELKESLEQQTATSEILGVNASSPTDIQPVLDAVAKNAALSKPQHHIIDPTHPSGAFDDGIEHRLHVRRRAADNAEYLRRCRLMLQRFAQFGVALLDLFEQPDILDGDHGLICKDFNERNLLVGKRTDLVASKMNHSDSVRFAKQRHYQCGSNP